MTTILKISGGESENRLLQTTNCALIAHRDIGVCDAWSKQDEGTGRLRFEEDSRSSVL